MTERNRVRQLQKDEDDDRKRRRNRNGGKDGNIDRQTVGQTYIKRQKGRQHQRRQEAPEGNEEER